MEVGGMVGVIIGAGVGRSLARMADARTASSGDGGEAGVDPGSGQRRVATKQVNEL